MKDDGNISIREAAAEDAPLILEFIKRLAEYEKLSDCVTATEEGLRESIFDKGYAHALICRSGGVPAGFAVYFFNYSTFVGKPGLYLEDIFVLPEYRGRGLGRALFARLGKIAEEKGCGRLELAVLDWNEPSIGFYKARGARPMDDWTVYRLDREAIAGLAAGDTAE